MTNIPSYYRSPAWSGLIPSHATYEIVTGELQRLINQVLGKGDLFLLCKSSENKFFKFVPSNVSEPKSYFLKIIPKNDAVLLIRAEKVSKWLLNQNVSVITQLSASPIELDHDRYLFLYPHIDSRFILPTVKEARLFGHLLGDFHQKLKKHPDIVQWRENTHKRAQHLKSVADDILDGNINLDLPISHSRIQNVFKEGGTDFLWSHQIDSPGHGDLNIFNVIVDRLSNKQYLLDFEDCFHSVLPVVFDVANAAFRMFISQEINDQKAYNLVCNFLEIYAESSGNHLKICDLAPAIKTLAARSTSILIDCHKHKIKIEKEEWEKFPAIIDYINKRSILFY